MNEIVKVVVKENGLSITEFVVLKNSLKDFVVLQHLRKGNYILLLQPIFQSFTLNKVLDKCIHLDRYLEVY